MSAELKLAPQEVHLWQVHMLAPDDEILRSRSVLSQDEIQRADRFYFENHRRRFIVAHAAMRTILSSYLNVLPPDVSFAYGPKGKPALSADLMGSGIAFNLSHSGDYALLAVAQNFCLGVDIEFVNQEFGTEGIATRFFSAKEIETLCAMPAPEKPAAFFSCWTRKEAYIKAVGDGLSIPLDSFDVAFGSGIAPCLLRVQVPGHKHWKMYDLPVPEGYKGALVVEGKKHQLQYSIFRSAIISPRPMDLVPGRNTVVAKRWDIQEKKYHHRSEAMSPPANPPRQKLKRPRGTLQEQQPARLRRSSEHKPNKKFDWFTNRK